MANYPSLHPASLIFPTGLYLRHCPAASAHPLMFSCGELFGRLHLMQEWGLQAISLKSFILGLQLQENAEVHWAIQVFSLHCTLLLANVANCAKRLHSSAVMGVSSLFFSRQALDSCTSWPLCSQCSEWIW